MLFFIRLPRTIGIFVYLTPEKGILINQFNDEKGSLLDRNKLCLQGGQSK